MTDDHIPPSAALLKEEAKHRTAISSRLRTLRERLSAALPGESQIQWVQDSLAASFPGALVHSGVMKSFAEVLHTFQCQPLSRIVAGRDVLAAMGADAAVFARVRDRCADLLSPRTMRLVHIANASRIQGVEVQAASLRLIEMLRDPDDNALRALGSLVMYTDAKTPAESECGLPDLTGDWRFECLMFPSSSIDGEAPDQLLHRVDPALLKHGAAVTLLPTNGGYYFEIHSTRPSRAAG